MRLLLLNEFSDLIFLSLMPHHFLNIKSEKLRSRWFNINLLTSVVQKYVSPAKMYVIGSGTNFKSFDLMETSENWGGERRELRKIFISNT